MIVDDRTTPPYCSVYGGTSVPPPEKLTRRGARERMIKSEVCPRGSSQKYMVWRSAGDQSDTNDRPLQQSSFRDTGFNRLIARVNT